YTSPSATGSLTFTPASGVNGSATITVTVNDGQTQNNTVTRSFVVTLGTAPTVTLFYEAEAGNIAAPMEIVADPPALNGQFIYAPAGRAGTATYTLNIPQAGDYVIWCRVIAPDPSTDSFYASVDGGAQDIFDAVLNTWSPVWQWSQFNGRANGVPW